MLCATTHPATAAAGNSGQLSADPRRAIAGLGDRPLTGLRMLAVVGDVGVAQRASCLDNFLDTPWTITPGLSRGVSE